LRAETSPQFSFIRDAEIEHTIRLFATPVFAAADLDAEAVKIYIVNDDHLNAFVAGGQRLFLHTGLLTRVQSPNQLIGVIAHETGHIAGGHLSRTHEALRNATAQTIVALLLGVAAAAAGSPEAAVALLQGGTHVAERSFLQYSRTQESSADQAALQFLDKTGHSPKGLIEFLQIIGSQEAMLYGRSDPYTRTHPLSNERILLLQQAAAASPLRDKPDAPENSARLQRLQAKLTGYLQGVEGTLKTYPLSDTGVPARYARAFAYYREADIENALREIEHLLASNPSDPYFHDFKGQILFEHGRIMDAIAPAQTAVKLAPAEPLLRLGLGQVLIATDDPGRIKDAIVQLEEAIRLEPDYAPAWAQLAVAYGRQNDIGMASLASAERFMLEGRKRDARGQAERALNLLPTGSPAAQRAQDIIDAAKQKT
jgi:predicted Zn-dependent protease